MATARGDLLGTAPMDVEAAEHVVRGVRGRVNDLDQHEVIPTSRWVEAFGEAVRPIADMFMQNFPEGGVLGLNARIEADDAPVTADLWQKGSSAPGAIDMNRRVEVLDYQGIDHALLFPTGAGFVGLALNPNMADALPAFSGVPETSQIAEWPGLEELGQRVCTAYNDWCLDVAKISPRTRAVAVIPTSSLDFAIAEVERVVNGGVQAVLVASAVPPGGMSPGHPDVDPLWGALAGADVPVMLHVAGDFGFLKSVAWGQLPNLARSRQSLEIEIGINPYSFSMAHLSGENFLTAMIYGGALERHPTLRIGVQELTAHWVSSMANNLKTIAEIFPATLKGLSLTPAEYLQRSVRVSPFVWEDVALYMSDPELEDVYCFGSDYPHYEGGADPIRRFASKLVHVDPRLAEKFFVTNGALLFPDRSHDDERRGVTVNGCN